MLGNDFGYESVFAKQLDYYGFRWRCLVAISSSGGVEIYSMPPKKPKKKA